MCRAPPVTMATLPLSLISHPCGIGILEYWNIGVPKGKGSYYSTIPTVHYSNIHSFISAFQMLFEVQRLPPRLDPERLGDDARRVVARSAGDVTARMTGRATQIKTVDRRSV